MRISPTAILLFLITTSVVNYSNAQNQKKEKYYWFTLTAKYIKHKETGQKVLSVEKIDKEIESGNLKDYEKSFMKSLKKNKICVGPYIDKELVSKSQKYFNVSNLGFDEADNYISGITDTLDMYYFYMANPVQDGNSKNFTFQRMPARIASGSIYEFVQLLYESSMFNKLAIGPFKNHISAEKSKYIFRKYGELDMDIDFTNKPKLDSLKKMAEKWKSVSIKNYIAIEEDVSAGNIRIEFPKLYFTEDVIQQITFGILSTDNQRYEVEGTTFQGELVQDNNTIIPLMNGRKVKYAFTIPSAFQNKIKNIYIKSTLFDNSLMLNCEDRIIYSKN